MDASVSQKSKMPDEPFQEIKVSIRPRQATFRLWSGQNQDKIRPSQRFDFLKRFVRHFRFLRHVITPEGTKKGVRKRKAGMTSGPNDAEIKRNQD